MHKLINNRCGYYAPQDFTNKSLNRRTEKALEFQGHELYCYVLL